MAESPRLTGEAVLADQALLTQLGVTGGFAAHIASMPSDELAPEIAYMWPGQSADAVLAELMGHGPDLPVVGETAQGPADPKSFPEIVVFLSRTAAHLGLELKEREGA